LAWQFLASEERDQDRGLWRTRHPLQNKTTFCKKTKTKQDKILQKNKKTRQDFSALDPQ
jgi:hypothetical protein